MRDKTSLWDNRAGYGLVSRGLHWLMAAMFLWQFVSAILHALDRQSAVARFFWSAHHGLGFALLVLVLLRGLWGLLNLRRRPTASGPLDAAAKVGHVVIYLLMFAVPALALLRAYGGGRGFSFLGLQIFAPTGLRDEALMAPGNAAHGFLGWVLLVVIAGHVLMALYHHFALRDDTLRRMTGH